MAWITDPDGIVRFYCACAHPAPPRRDVPQCRWCGVACCEQCIVHDDTLGEPFFCYCPRCWEIGVYYRQRLEAGQTRYKALQDMCLGMWKAAALEAAAGVAVSPEGETLCEESPVPGAMQARTVLRARQAHAVSLDNLRTVSESNQREHWQAKHRRAKTQRSAVFYWLRHLLGAPCPVKKPMTITLTRVAPRQLDSGNLEASLKSIQDGCADYISGTYLGGQDRQPGLTWRYAQRRGAVGRYGVDISFALSETDATWMALPRQ